LKSEEKLLGIKGLRGVGKTTLLLQYIQSPSIQSKKSLYVTADHPYFYKSSLFDLATLFYAYSGELLVIDEVHKYSNWSRELKLIYDGFPKLKVIFTSSSALDLYRGESDLSRRLVTQNLEGLSFREYLSLVEGVTFQKMSLAEILTNHDVIVKDITSKIHPLSFFQKYLEIGYFPSIQKTKAPEMKMKLFQTINTVLESDLAFSKDYSPANILKIKKLLGVIAVTVPFEPNISAIAAKLGLGRNTVYSFLAHLQDAKIIRLINKPNRGINYLQKPDKIYFDNSNFAFALQEDPNKGTIRETFFANQLANSNHKIELSEKGDFLVNEEWTFEIGGRAKQAAQIKSIDKSFLALDDIEVGFGNRIPLWLFGFLY
jgi:predicted AAA+ superfamily ATPase